MNLGLRPLSLHPACAPSSSHPALGCHPACCLAQNMVLVSRHLRFGWDTIKANRDALWDLKLNKRKIKRQSVLAGVSRVRWRAPEGDIQLELYRARTPARAGAVGTAGEGQREAPRGRVRRVSC